MAFSPSTSPRLAGASIRSALQQLHKDSRSRKIIVVILILFACAYAVLLVVSGYPCPPYSSEADSAYCRFAAWSAVFVSASYGQSMVLRPTPYADFAPVQNVSQDITSRSTSIDRIVFGIGASADSWEQRSGYIKLWWKPEVTRGFVWVDRQLDNWKQGDPPFKVSEDTARFSYTHPSQVRSALRIARIVAESFRLGLSDVDWFVLGDDDTLFFTENLVKVLSKYDHSKFHYIGTNSEDIRQSARHHYGLAFGGGGFAISYPLARALSEIQDQCIERYAWLYGSDERIKACVSELGVPLTKEPGFHQLDVRGDISGLLAAHPVAPIVSLHHLEEFNSIFYGTNHLDGVKRLMKAVDVDPASIFQQSICYDEENRWSFSVSWGYVVEVYEGFVTPRDLEVPATTFTSWSGSTDFDSFTMDTRPLSEVCTRPTRFFMLDAKMKGKGNKRLTISVYERLHEFKDANCPAKALPMQTVETVHVESKPIQEDWFQNPRRQCCRVTSLDARSLKILTTKCRESGGLVGRKALIAR